MEGTAPTSASSSTPDVTSDYVPGSWPHLASLLGRGHSGPAVLGGPGFSPGKGARPSCLSSPRDVLAAEHRARGCHRGQPGSGGCAGGWGPGPSLPPLLGKPALPRPAPEQTLSALQTSTLCPQPEGPLGLFPGPGRWLAVNTCLLRGMPASLRRPAPPRQPDKRVWGCNAPSLWSSDSEGRESGRGQVAPVSCEQCPDSFSVNPQPGCWGPRSGAAGSDSPQTKGQGGWALASCP